MPVSQRTRGKLLVTKAHPAGPGRRGQRLPESTAPLNSSCAAGGSTAGGAGLGPGPLPVRGGGEGPAESGERSPAPGEAAAPAPRSLAEAERMSMASGFFFCLLATISIVTWSSGAISETGVALLLFFSSPFFSPASSRRSPRSASRQVRCPEPAGVFPRRRTSPGGSGRERGPARGALPCAAVGSGPGPGPQPGRLLGGPYVGAGCRGARRGGLPPEETAELFLPSLFACSRRGFYSSLCFSLLFFSRPISPSSLPCLICFLDHLSFPLPFVRVRNRTHLTLKICGERARSQPAARSRRVPAGTCRISARPLPLPPARSAPSPL